MPNASNFVLRWTEVWFRPSPLVNLAIIRIVCVGLQLFLLIAHDAYNYGRLGELADMPDAAFYPRHILRLITLPFGWEVRPAPEVMVVLYGLTLVAGVFALVGLWTNLGLITFAFGCITLQAHAYSYGDLHHPEALMMIALSSLALSPAGRVFSLDALRQTRNFRGGSGANVGVLEQQSEFAYWPLLLVQCFFALIYLDAGLRKMHAGGLDWMNGYTLQYYLFKVSLMRDNAFAFWLGQQHNIVQLLSIITIVFELSFFVVLFRPKAAWIYVPLGLSLHVGMCVAHVACFYQFMVLYAVFIPWSSILARVFGRRWSIGDRLAAS